MKDCVHNYFVATWHKTGNRWTGRGRYPTPQEAVQRAELFHCTTVVIDLVNGRTLWTKGKYCSRQRPSGLTLPAMETYADDTPPKAQETGEVVKEVWGGGQ